MLIVVTIPSIKQPEFPARCRQLAKQFSFSYRIYLFTATKRELAYRDAHLNILHSLPWIWKFQYNPPIVNYKPSHVNFIIC